MAWTRGAEISRILAEEKPGNAHYIAILVIFLIISVLVSVFFIASGSISVVANDRPPPLPDDSEFVGPPDSSLPQIAGDNNIPTFPGLS